METDMSKEKTLGVVIGRFQIHELHEGHVALLDLVEQKHEQMLILVGHNSIRFNTADPFPFHIRKQMLESRYPRATVLPLPDSPISNEHWSETVDAKVSSVSYNGGSVLYGSRDSFIPKYHGKFSTEEVPELPNRSATQVREEAAGNHIDDSMFRLGWLAAINAQHAVTDPTVDVVIHTPDWSKILMGRRGPGSALRFFGGFVDPEDESLEAAVSRERAEEALGIEVREPEYVGSCRIKDPRYAKSCYGIMTTLFAMEYLEGNVSAGDDMGVAEWVKLTPDLRNQIAEEHRPLFDLLFVYKKQ
tara:strand:- start:3277 stop:4185 length:909 start_codon:yes stop_codon:yes gene_type:complete